MIDSFRLKRFRPTDMTGNSFARGSRTDQIHWVCHSPSPYNDYLFSALAVALQVPIRFHFTENDHHSNGWTCSADIDHRYYSRKFGIDWTALRAACGSLRFVTNCWQDRTSQLAILYRIATGKPYLLWNDTPNEDRHRPPLLRMARSLFLKLAFRHARAAMGTGRPALEVFARIGCPEDRLVDFPYFIDNVHFHPVPRARTNTIVFGSCGRLQSIKGFDIALQALAKLKKPFRYLIAGAGPEESRLRELACRLDISERVEFRGWIPYERAPAFYHDLDVFLHPARWEPHGVAVLEAMASGLPVIASDRTAAALDRIEHGRNGFIHRAEDRDSLAFEIGRTMSLNLAGIGAAARATAEEWPVSRAASILSTLIAPTAEFAYGKNR